MTEKQQEQEDNGEIDEGKLGSLLSNIKLFVCMYLYDKLTKRNGIYNTLFIGLCSFFLVLCSC